MEIRVVIFITSLFMVTGAFADSLGEPGRDSEGGNPLKNVYFGEQHLHTANSPDAFAMGTRNTPDDALVRRRILTPINK